MRHNPVVSNMPGGIRISKCQRRTAHGMSSTPCSYWYEMCQRVEIKESKGRWEGILYYSMGPVASPESAYIQWTQLVSKTQRSDVKDTNRPSCAGLSNGTAQTLHLCMKTAPGLLSPERRFIQE